MTRYDYYDGELHESEDEGAYTLYSEAEAELRRCRVETLREAASVISKLRRKPDHVDFQMVRELHRLADEAEQEASNERA